MGISTDKKPGRITIWSILPGWIFNPNRKTLAKHLPPQQQSVSGREKELTWGVGFIDPHGFKPKGFELQFKWARCKNGAVNQQVIIEDENQTRIYYEN
jgi:hypothetical protein